MCVCMNTIDTRHKCPVSVICGKYNIWSGLMNLFNPGQFHVKRRTQQFGWLQCIVFEINTIKLKNSKIYLEQCLLDMVHCCMPFTEIKKTRKWEAWSSIQEYNQHHFHIFFICISICTTACTLVHLFSTNVLREF